MKKKNFVSLIFCVVGGILFALGMCMCLLPEWKLFNQGVAAAAAGALILLIMLLVRRRMSGRRGVRPRGKTVGAVLLCIAGALILGMGMCMAMMWNMMLSGILVGLLGIVMLLCLIPICKGLE